MATETSPPLVGFASSPPSQRSDRGRPGQVAGTCLQGELNMTDTEKNQLAQTFMSGLRNRDWNLLHSIMTSGIIWTVPGSSLISAKRVA